LILNFRRVLIVVFFLWVIPRHLNFMRRNFETICQFHLHGWCQREEYDKVFRNVGT